MIPYIFNIKIYIDLSSPIISSSCKVVQQERFVGGQQTTTVVVEANRTLSSELLIMTLIYNQLFILYTALLGIIPLILH